MVPPVNFSKEIDSEQSLVVLCDELAKAESFCQTPAEFQYAKRQFDQGNELIVLNRYAAFLFLVIINTDGEAYKLREKCRKLGNEIQKLADKEKLESLQLKNEQKTESYFLDLFEGLLLSNYHFGKYKKEKKKTFPESLTLLEGGFDTHHAEDVANIAEGVFATRDLVNEPVSYLTAQQFAKSIEELGKASGFEVKVLQKKEIEEERMEALLAVNKGSIDPPTFSILEYAPENSVNEKPIVLVGKGVVYDTGGLSLKPTENSMDIMKCDMAGGGAVVGTFVAIAKSKLPVKVVGLIPATDNRPGGNAYAPGDVIGSRKGSTIEVANTDAEGRLVMADALDYARELNPELVFDLATLTGAAIRAIGQYGIVYMGNAGEDVKNQLEEAGKAVFERLVELPLWEDYGDELKSGIADIRNLGSNAAGAITAGKFLEHFVDYNWVHFDIAGPAYLLKEDSYRGKFGTGAGVRLLVEFFKKLVHRAENN